MRRRVAAGGLAAALAVKLCVDALPEAAVAVAFLRPAARLAAFHLGAAYDPTALTISAHGVTLAVVRACAATDFFSMVCALFAFALPIRALALRLPAALAAAWLVAVLANAARLVGLVFADACAPASSVSAVHMAVGIAVFLPVFALLWYTLVVRKEVSRGQHAVD
ncbi:MAG: hypothetical protein II924_04270 [Kiritimatiellae bacterium]|nr:hypothetical protein [Kiritimatiellia bacterium]